MQDITQTTGESMQRYYKNYNTLTINYRWLVVNLQSDLVLLLFILFSFNSLSFLTSINFKLHKTLAVKNIFRPLDNNYINSG